MQISDIDRPHNRSSYPTRMTNRHTFTQILMILNINHEWIYLSQFIRYLFFHQINAFSYSIELQNYLHDNSETIRDLVRSLDHVLQCKYRTGEWRHISYLQILFIGVTACDNVTFNRSGRMLAPVILTICLTESLSYSHFENNIFSITRTHTYPYWVKL